MNLKEQIKEYLKQTGLRPYQLADAAGVSRTSIYRFLKNERGLLHETAERISHQLDRQDAA